MIKMRKRYRILQEGNAKMNFGYNFWDKASTCDFVEKSCNNFGKIYLIIRVLQVILKYEEKYV